jgi:hypothetical protein
VSHPKRSVIYSSRRFRLPRRLTRCENLLSFSSKSSVIFPFPSPTLPARIQVIDSSPLRGHYDGRVHCAAVWLSR